MASSLFIVVFGLSKRLPYRVPIKSAGAAEIRISLVLIYLPGELSVRVKLLHIKTQADRAEGLFYSSQPNVGGFVGCKGLRNSYFMLPNIIPKKSVGSWSFSWLENATKFTGSPRSCFSSQYERNCSLARTVCSGANSRSEQYCFSAPKASVV